MRLSGLFALTIFLSLLPHLAAAGDAPASGKVSTPAISPSKAPRPVRTSDDLKGLVIDSRELEIRPLNVRKNKEFTDLLDQSMERDKDGYGAFERSVKNQIDRGMKAVNTEGLTPELRSELAKRLRQDLLRTADFYIHQGKLPDAGYREVGASDYYINEMKRQKESALNMIEDAILQLKPLL